MDGKPLNIKAVKTRLGNNIYTEATVAALR
jgi:hypothetical protein